MQLATQITCQGLSAAAIDDNLRNDVIEAFCERIVNCRVMV